jgi:TRAP-type uncharacterized transport system substrate-binding protein
LEKNTQHDSQIRLVNKQTNGGAENAVRVLTTRASFGLLQENTLSKSDMIRQKIRFVTPLYLERMHVLYRKDKAPDLQLKANLQAKEKDFFKKARINAGPVGSSTLIIASYILDFIEKDLQTVNDVTLAVKSMSTTEAIRALEGDKLDVHFVMSAAPIPEITEALKNENIGLMAIDPSMVAKINKQFGITLRIADFRDIYSQEVTTLGSYSQLVCSKDVSEADAVRVAQMVKEYENEIQSGFAPHGHLPLSEFDFYQTVSDDSFERSMKFVRSLLIFLVSVFATTGFLTTAIVWSISNGKNARYFSTYKDLRTETSNLRTQTGEHESTDSEINIKELIKQLLDLEERRSRAVESLIIDASTGGITDTHFLRLNDLFRDLQLDIRARIKNEYEFRTFQGIPVCADALKECLQAGLLELGELKPIESNGHGQRAETRNEIGIEHASKEVPQLKVLLSSLPIATLEDFESCSAEQLLAVKGFGAKSLEKLTRLLKRSGIDIT